ncbi:hypothetical protein JIR23_19925 [Bradyrhizobium diazoefficiens]|nr:hypothetical protein [Bradyrhizobium diazoefficiens]QQN61882.1 hypothetical protein JIR23_19925 [Bradyrhizobium diazoefficiens]
MLKIVTSAAVYGTYIIVAVFLGFVLWRTLFDDEKGKNPNEAQSAQTEQQRSNENLPGAGAPPSLKESTDDVIAAYTKWLAVFTALLVLATVALFVSGERNVGAASKAADAASDSAKAALAQLKLIEADQRPWIDITKIQVAEDISFYADGAHIALSFDLTNVGKSPAMLVEPWISAFIEGHGVSRSGQEYKKPPFARLDKAENIVFPSRMIPRTAYSVVPAEQVQQAAKDERKWFDVTILLCAEYHFVGSSDPHQTCHVLNITGADGKIVNLSDPISTIPKDGLKVTYRPYSSIAN